MAAISNLGFQCSTSTQHVLGDLWSSWFDHLQHYKNMSSGIVNIAEVDINEAFDDILFGEEIAEKTGFEEGYEAGRNRLTEPYHLGYHRASQIAAQLGYYSGILEHNLKANLFVGKVTQLAISLQNDIANFPQINSEELDILKTFEEIKLKYSRICSLAKIKSTYPETDHLDF